MGRLARTLVVSSLLCLATAGTAAAQDPVRIGTKVAEVAERDVQATCRVAGGPCQQEASQQAIDDFNGSWTHEALLFQHALGNDVGMANAPWAATHNSYNSIAEMGPALSTLDSNQQIGLTEQLDIGIRSLEIDVHRFAGRPVVCHARGANEGHAGCSVERELAPVLDEVGAWLRAHPREVVMLYLEDHLENAAGYDAAAAAVNAELGDVLFRPAVSKTGTACAKLSDTLTRDDILAAGKNAFVVSDCGPGAGWRTVAFDWGNHVETQPKGFTAFPDCGDDFTRSVFDSTLVRYYEDATGLSAGVAQVSGEEESDPITPATARAMARCGVDHIGFDHLVPGDGRLDALVWSWNDNQPAGTGACVVQRSDERWQTGSCEAPSKRVAACRRADGSWTTTRRPVRLRHAGDACADRGGAFAAPRTGYENALVRRAAGDEPVLLGLVRDAGGSFAPVDAR